MATRYCPNCGKVVIAKVIGKYSQVNFNGIPVKRREIVHLESDGGCGHCWYTLELPEEILNH